HHHPASLSADPCLTDLFKLLKRLALPVSMSCPLINLSPTFVFLAAIPSDPSKALFPLSRKTTFLLAMAAFLRPSNLHRVILSKCCIDGQHRLHLVIEAPKEMREGRCIVKSPIIHPHSSNLALCPVLAFSVLRDHPAALSHPVNTLFVCSKRPSLPFLVITISSWLSTLTQMYTLVKPCLSIRSLASNLAIQSGAPLDDVVAMGKWSSPSVFDTHYRRLHALCTNITESVLPADTSTVSPPISEPQ
ncbi:hypothetical protein CLU79DRAFT_713204, partial [Phycomyces nitens]